MAGYPLSSIDPNNLVPVPDDVNVAERFDGKGSQPLYHTVPDFDERVWEGGLKDYQRRKPEKPLGDQGECIPEEVMEACGFPIDVYAKIQFATVIMCSFYDRFDKAQSEDVNWWLAWKLKNAMWHWGNHHDWNTQAYANQFIPRFELPIFDDIVFETSTYHNFRGWSVGHRDIFLDGPLAYICYMEGKPVMTISFALAGPNKILITQIQPIGRGNRWLFKFDRKKEVIKAFSKAFEGFKIYLVTGDSAVESIDSQLVKSVSEETRFYYDRKREHEKNPESEFYTEDSVARQKEIVRKCEEHLDHFRTISTPRMKKFYPKGRGSVGAKGLRFKKVA